MEYPFWPARVFFEPAALEYRRGRELLSFFKEKGLPVKMTASHNRVTGIPGKTAREGFEAAKETLVVGVRRSGAFQPCKPSAHYQLPLATGCPGRCRYCYLHTTLGRKPYLRAYINVSEILERAGRYIRERQPELTLFEGAAVSDPLFVEPYTHAVSEAIEYFAGTGKGRFRLVSKFTNVDPFLRLRHGGHTRFRFSINAPDNIERFEKSTPPLEERLAAACKIIDAGYPGGFLVAPLFLKGGWRERYRALLEQLHRSLPEAEQPLTFELISHRFTMRARNNIMTLFPEIESDLEMDPEKRQFRYGQFGYGKYLYPASLLKEASAFFKKEIKRLFPGAVVEYFI